VKSSTGRACNAFWRPDTTHRQLEAETTQNSWLKRLREVYEGLTQDPAQGGCAGDPSAWQRDINRRARERDVAQTDPGKSIAPVEEIRQGSTVATPPLNRRTIDR
jgi:hypothetical protein